jgi:hypothetical protein
VAADSLGAQRVGQIAWDLSQRFVAATHVLPDRAIRDAQRRLWRDLRLAVEPGAALGMAALWTGAVKPDPAERVAVVLCGANVDPATLARDQALEQQKRDKAARKERAAQGRQLVEPNALPRLETDDYYNFVHDGRIARVGVDAARRAALIGGSLVIVRSHGQYLVVPAEIAARVREREPRAVVHDAADGTSSGGAAADAASSTPADDDPYAQFKVPDDLVW